MTTANQTLIFNNVVHLGSVRGISRYTESYTESNFIILIGSNLDNTIGMKEVHIVFKYISGQFRQFILLLIPNDC